MICHAIISLAPVETSGAPNAASAASIVGWPSPWIATRSPRSMRMLPKYCSCMLSRLPYAPAYQIASSSDAFESAAAPSASASAPAATPPPANDAV